jgi:hypothetical protein
LAFVAPLHLQEKRCKPHRINVCPQLAADESFAGATRSKASFSPITLMFGIFYPQHQRNQSFGQPHPAQPIDSKPLTPKSFIMYVFPVATT